MYKSVKHNCLWLCSAPDTSNMEGMMKLFLLCAAFFIGRNSAEHLISTLKANIRYPSWKQTARVTIETTLLTPDGKLLIGGMLGPAGKYGLVFTTMQEPHDIIPVPEVPATVRSMALLNDGKVILTSESEDGNDVTQVLDVTGDGVRVVEEMRFNNGRTNAGRYRVAYNPSDDTLIVGGHDDDADTTFIDVMSRDGDVIENVIETADFTVDQLIFHDGDVYITGYNKRAPNNLMRLNLAAKTLVTKIGSLDLASAFNEDYTFVHGDFDSAGNLFIGAKNSEGCSFSDDLSETCCKCVLRIAPDGEKLVIRPYRIWPIDIQGVTVTPPGLAVSWQLVDYQDKYKSLVELRDLEWV